MKLSEILKQDAEGVYQATEGLFKLVDDLEWKPATGKNWMNTAQLLMHCTNACGMSVKGFVTGEWPMPEGVTPGESPPEAMLPTAERLPGVKSVDEALKLLGQDRALATKMFDEAGEERLANERSRAPWGGPERSLFQHCHEMIWHLGQHKAQLYYYLKLQGKDVNTMNLWMGGD